MTEMLAGPVVNLKGWLGAEPVHLVVPTNVILEVIRHCQSKGTEEACGVLVAHDGDRARFLPITNVHPDSPRAYRFDEGEYVALLRGLERTGERLLCVVHSHPDGPPQPSPTDLERAVPEVVHWLIVDLSGFPQLFLYRVGDDGTAVAERLALVD